MQAQQPIIHDYVIQSLANQNMLAPLITFPLNTQKTLDKASYLYYFQELHRQLNDRKTQCQILELTRAPEALEALGEYLHANPNQAFFKELVLDLGESQDPNLIQQLISTIKAYPELAALKLITSKAKQLSISDLEPLVAYVQGSKSCTEIQVPTENAGTQQLLDDLYSEHQRDKRIAEFGLDDPEKRIKPKTASTEAAPTGFKRTRKKLKHQNVGIDIEIQQQIEVAAEESEKPKPLEADEENDNELISRDDFVKRMQAKQWNLPESFYTEHQHHEKRLWDNWLGNISQIVIHPEPVEDTFEYPVSGPAKIKWSYLRKDGSEYKKDNERMGLADSYYSPPSDYVPVQWQTKEIMVDCLTHKYKFIVKYNDKTEWGKTSDYPDFTIFQRKGLSWDQYKKIEYEVPERGGYHTTKILIDEDGSERVERAYGDYDYNVNLAYQEQSREWKSKEILVQQGERQLKLEIQYNDETKFGTKTVKDFGDEWKKETTYDAAQYPEDDATLEALRVNAPKKYRNPSLSPKLIESPHCQQMTSAACERLMEYRHQLQAGLDFGTQRLPAGFKLKEKAINGRIVSYLDYDPKYAQEEPDFLTLALEKSPVMKPLSSTLFKQWLLKQPKSKVDLILLDRYQRLLAKGYQREAVDLFKQHLPLLQLMTEAELKALGPHFEDLIAGAKAQAFSLKAKRADLNQHWLITLLHAQPNLLEQIKYWDKKLQLTNSDLNGLLSVYDAFGEKGLKAVFVLFESCSPHLLKNLHEQLFSKMENYEALASKKYAEAINIINHFKPKELIWWNSLLEQHLEAVGADNLYTLSKAFQAFVKEANVLGLNFYENPKFKDIKSLPLTLSRMLTILHNTKKVDLPTVWESITELNFNSNAAIRVVTDGQASLGSGRLVLPLLQTTPEHYYTMHDQRYQNSGEPKHGYHSVQVSRQDPARKPGLIESYMEEIFSDEADSFQQLIGYSQTQKELDRNYYRYLADQDHRLSIGFYKKVAAMVDYNFPDTLFYNSFNLRAAMYAIIAVSTTGFDVLPLLDDEETCLKTIQTIIDNFSSVSFPSILPIPDKLIREIMLREGFLKMMKPVPPLKYMSEMVLMLRKGFTISTFDLLTESSREAMEQRGRKYMSYFNLVSDLLKQYKYSYFDGLRFLAPAEVTEENMFKYAHFAVHSIGYGRASRELHSSLVCLMTAFKLTDRGLEHLALNERQKAPFICALALLAKMQTNISSKTSQALTEDDFRTFVTELLKNVNDDPDADSKALEKIAVALIKERFGDHFSEGMIETLQSENLSDAVTKLIRSNFMNMEEQTAVEGILRCYPNLSDILQREDAVKKMSRIYAKLTEADKTIFLNLLAKLNKHFDGSLLELNDLLDVIGERGRIDDFVFMLSCPEAKEAQHLIAKIKMHYQIVLPYLAKHPHEQLSTLDLLPISAGLLLKAKTEAANFAPAYEGFMSSLYALVNAYPNEHGVILDLLKSYVDSLALGIPVEEHMTRAVEYINELKSKLLEQENPDLVRSLCDHYKTNPAGLSEILACMELGFSKEERGVFLETLSALLNNDCACPFETFRDFVQLCRGERRLLALTREFFLCPPYPKIETIQEWHLRFVGQSNYFELMRAEYLQFNTHPCPREAENGFKIDEARLFAAKFIGLQFSEEDFQALAKESLAVQALLSGELQREVANYGKLSEADKIKGQARLLACTAELLHRAKGTPGPLGSSFELSTVQYLAIYAFLKVGHHITNEIATGEGKSRIMMVANALSFAQNKTADFVTSDMQLAQRDFLTYKALFKILGAETSLISSTSPVSAYKVKGVNFSDASNLSLFRNKAKSSGLGHLTIDPDPKARALLLDEADRTEFDVSETRYNYSQEANDNIKGMDWIYEYLVRFFSHDDLERYVRIRELYHDDMDACNQEFLKFVKAQPEYRDEMMERILALPNSQLEAWQEAAYTALDLKLGQDYDLEPNIMVNTQRGPKMASEARLIYGFRNSKNSKFSFGVHQCLHAYLNQQLKDPSSDASRMCAAKDAASAAPQGTTHEFPLHPEKQIVYSSTSKSFLYDYEFGDLWAVTGTAGSIIEREEAALLYGQSGEAPTPMKFVTVPRNKVLRRVDHELRLLGDFDQKIMALKAYIDESRAAGRPVLLISENDKESERIRKVLEAHYPASERAANQWQHVDSGTSSEDEAAKVAIAGTPGCVTFATPRMGRGTDIKLPKVAKEAGGLDVLVSFLPSERDMWQIFGRSGRYGDNGDARIVCTEQELAARLGKTAVDSEFYFSPEYYIKQEQARMDREKQMERLVRNALSDFRIKITDAFFRYYDSLATMDVKEKKAKVLLWSDYTKKVDQLWNQAWPDLLSILMQPKADMHIIMCRLDQFKRDTQSEWDQLHTALKIDEKELPRRLVDLTLDFRTEYLMRIMMPRRKYSLSDKTQVYKAYDKAHDGRAVVYDELFADWKAIWRGERVLFANTCAWWNGHGILFADTRAWWAGKRPLFANFRAWLHNTFIAVPESQEEVSPNILEVLEQHDEKTLKKFNGKLNVMEFLEPKKNDATISLRVELVEAVLDYVHDKVEGQEELSNEEMDQMHALLKAIKMEEGESQKVMRAVANQLQYCSSRFFGPSLKSKIGQVVKQRFEEHCLDENYKQVVKKLEPGCSLARPVLNDDDDLIIPKLISPGGASAA